MKHILLGIILFSFSPFLFSQTQEGESSSDNESLGQLLVDQTYNDYYDKEVFQILDTIVIDVNSTVGSTFLTLGEEYLVTVSFVNTLLDDIVIKGFSNPCACIIAEWSSTTIPAGSTGFFKLKYRSTIIGLNEKKLTVVFYNADGIKPAAKLPVVITSNTVVPQLADN